jgi:hypothetical protein
MINGLNFLEEIIKLKFHRPVGCMPGECVMYDIFFFINNKLKFTYKKLSAKKVLIFFQKETKTYAIISKRNKNKI